MGRKKHPTETGAVAAQDEDEPSVRSAGPVPSGPSAPPCPSPAPPAIPAEPAAAIAADAVPARLNKDAGALERELEEAGRRLTEARARADGNLALLQRVAADYENYKKFAERERAESVLRERSAALSDFLDPYENLERAIAAGSKELPDGSRLMKGLRMTLEQMRGTFERAGVRAMETVGRQFDPSLHEAVYFVADRCRPEYSVVEEVRRGYTMNGRVLRTAKVCVATRPAPATPEKKGPDTESPKDDKLEE